MTEILIFLATKCEWLFRPGRYRFTDSRVDTSFGNAMVLLESSILRFMFERERGRLLVSFQPIRGNPRDWYSLGLLRGVVLGDRGGSEVLNDEWATFLGEYLAQLEEIFASDDERSRDMVRRLKDQKRLRAKSL
jgi:hypothetical protein